MAAALQLFSLLLLGYDADYLRCSCKLFQSLTLSRRWKRFSIVRGPLFIFNSVVFFVIVPFSLRPSRTPRHLRSTRSRRKRRTNKTVSSSVIINYGRETFILFSMKYCDIEFRAVAITVAR